MEYPPKLYRKRYPMILLDRCIVSTARRAQVAENRTVLWLSEPTVL